VNASIVADERRFARESVDDDLRAELLAALNPRAPNLARARRVLRESGLSVGGQIRALNSVAPGRRNRTYGNVEIQGGPESLGAILARHVAPELAAAPRTHDERRALSRRARRGK
jgi:hypothetical protein